MMPISRIKEEPDKKVVDVSKDKDKTSLRVKKPDRKLDAAKEKLIKQNPKKAVEEAV